MAASASGYFFSWITICTIILKILSSVGKLVIIHITGNCVRKIFVILFFMDFFINFINNLKKQQVAKHIVLHIVFLQWNPFLSSYFIQLYQNCTLPQKFYLKLSKSGTHNFSNNKLRYRCLVGSILLETGIHYRAFWKCILQFDWTRNAF